MPIEGPLRELSIHDVFQLLDLSRKTGALTVASTLRDNQGTVYFHRGGVVFAVMHSNPHPLGELLVRAGRVSEGDLQRALALQGGGDDRTLGEILVALGAINQRELERQVRFQIEEIVFDLMSWEEGYFSFEERPEQQVPAAANIRVSTESLLMEAARRIDEWSRIAGKIPHAGVVPVLATVRDGQSAQLDLLPSEWEVLAEIDGVRTLREIASRLVRSEFEVAKVTFGLVTTGVVEVRGAEPPGAPRAAASDPRRELARASQALLAGDVERAVAAARQASSIDPHSADARLILARALTRLGRHADASAELRRATQIDALNAEVYLELGYASLRHGDFADAQASWARYLRMAPQGREASRVRVALEATERLRAVLEERDRDEAHVPDAPPQRPAGNGPAPRRGSGERERV